MGYALGRQTLPSDNGPSYSIGLARGTEQGGPWKRAEALEDGRILEAVSRIAEFAFFCECVPPWVRRCGFVFALSFRAKVGRGQCGAKVAVSQRLPGRPEPA